MADTSVEQINAALQRYYQLMGVEYDNQFTTYCEDNGFDDMNYELISVDNASDCMLIEFDTAVPFKIKPSDHTQAIYDLLVKICQDPDCDLTTETNAFHALQVTASDWKITRDDLKNIKAIHEAQLTTIWNGDIQKDKNVLALLAISHKIHAPYFTYLVDLFSRDRAAVLTHKGHTLTEMAWVHQNKYCKELKKLKASYIDVVQHGLLSFSHRVCAKLRLNSGIRIDDSLPAVARYMQAQVEFVYSITQEKQAVCPFQVDMSIVFDNVQKEESKQDNDYEEDTDDDDLDSPSEYDDEQQLNSAVFVDVIGNVKHRLKYNKLMHQMSVIHRDDEKSVPIARIKRQFQEQFGTFRHKLSQDKGDAYPHNHRFCCLVDRRQPNGDALIFYEPPGDCNRIPNEEQQEVDLWYFDASRTCILPQSDRKNEVNIDSGYGANGALIVLSFHVLSVNEIRAYLYWNGQVVRFFPEDMVSIVPELFVGNEMNKAFKESAKGNEIVKQMKTKLRDEKFEAFYNQYGATHKN
eukprot:123562_1